MKLDPIHPFGRKLKQIQCGQRAAGTQAGSRSYRLPAAPSTKGPRSAGNNNHDDKFCIDVEPKRDEIIP